MLLLSTRFGLLVRCRASDYTFSSTVTIGGVNGGFTKVGPTKNFSNYNGVLRTTRDANNWPRGFFLDTSW